MTTKEALQNVPSAVLAGRRFDIDAQVVHLATTLAGWLLSPISIKGAGAVEAFFKSSGCFWQPVIVKRMSAFGKRLYRMGDYIAVAIM